MPVSLFPRRIVFSGRCWWGISVPPCGVGVPYRTGNGRAEATKDRERAGGRIGEKSLLFGKAAGGWNGSFGIGIVRRYRRKSGGRFSSLIRPLRRDGFAGRLRAGCRCRVGRSGRTLVRRTERGLRETNPEASSAGCAAMFGATLRWLKRSGRRRLPRSLVSGTRRRNGKEGFA